MRMVFTATVVATDVPGQYAVMVHGLSRDPKENAAAAKMLEGQLRAAREQVEQRIQVVPSMPAALPRVFPVNGSARRNGHKH